MNTLRLAWFSPHPIHYNNFLFEHLTSALPISLHLFFFNKVLSNYPWKKEMSSDSAYVFNRTFGIDWKLLFRLIISDTKAFDSIVIAGWSEPTMILLLTYFRIFKKPYILYTDTPNINRKKNLKQWLRGVWLSWTLSESRAVLVTGVRGIKILETWGAQKETIYNFPFATDLNYFSPSTGFPAPFGAPIKIFSSGRLDIQHKGYDTAIHALALVKQRRPEVMFSYTIAGTGPDEPLIRKLIADLNLNTEVKLLGWLETDDLLKHYTESDVLLHTAVNDPFPNAVLEAMACGLIVIGSDSSGSVLERIEDRVNGLIHRTHDQESVFDCLSYLADRNNDEIMTLKRNAFETSRMWGVEYNIRVMNEILFTK